MSVACFWQMVKYDTRLSKDVRWTSNRSLAGVHVHKSEDDVFAICTAFECGIWIRLEVCASAVYCCGLENREDLCALRLMKILVRRRAVLPFIYVFSSFASNRYRLIYCNRLHAWTVMKLVAEKGGRQTFCLPLFEWKCKKADEWEEQKYAIINAFVV